MTDANPTPKEWYADGLRFECTQCGNCCTGPTGFVWVSDDELEVIAATLGIRASETEARYTRRLHGRRSLTETPGEQGYDCVFLDRNSVPGKAVCGIYGARPTQCRTWPFWPENLRHPRDWQRAGRTCPGLNHGSLVPIESIRIQRDGTPK